MQDSPRVALMTRNKLKDASQTWLEYHVYWINFLFCFLYLKEYAQAAKIWTNEEYKADEYSQIVNKLVSMGTALHHITGFAFTFTFTFNFEISTTAVV